MTSIGNVPDRGRALTTSSNSGGVANSSSASLAGANQAQVGLKLKGLAEQITLLSKDISALLKEIEAHNKTEPRAPQRSAFGNDEKGQAAFNQAQSAYQAQHAQWLSQLNALQNSLKQVQAKQAELESQYSHANGAEMQAARAADDKILADEAKRAEESHLKGKDSSKDTSEISPEANARREQIQHALQGGPPTPATGIPSDGSEPQV